MKIIVAVDENWAIGNKGKLLVSIKEDLKRFKDLTTGNVIILGRKTLDTFPQGLPLRNRTNIILSGKKDYMVKDAIVVNSIDELLDVANNYSEEIYVVGGESVYRQLLPYCDEALVTYIANKYESDAFFPNLDDDEEWKLVDESDEMTCFDIEYTFRKYVRISN